MFTLQEELQHIGNPSQYIITNDIDPSDEDAIATALERARLIGLCPWLDRSPRSIYASYRCRRSHRRLSGDYSRTGSAGRIQESSQVRVEFE